MDSSRKWHDILRHQRELRGWTQQQVAKALRTDEKRVSSWECGVSKPSPHYRARLCKLYGKNAEELGLVEQHEPLEPPITQHDYPSASLTLHQQDVQRRSSPESAWRMPLPPHPYFAHPYPLQINFTGRVRERQMLTTWLTEDRQPVLALVALGGMGKSSLVWAWLQQEVLNLPEATRPHGVLWWSFYEPEATFKLFLDRALIYTSRGTADPRDIPSIYEKMQTLIALLQRHRFLLILDCFERALRAYASLNAAYQGNDVPRDAQGNFRVCIDPHIGSFLRWLAAGPLSSKVLLTTRLLPRELDGLVGCQREELLALKTEDAVSFFRAQGVQGTRAETEALCTYYGNHPLALRLLTGLIVNDPARPGEVAVANDYHPLSELVQREHHIFTLAYDALQPPLQQFLSQLAAFRSKANFEMMKVVSPFETEKALKAGLRELVERGLLFFNREQRYYDLHPVLRQFAYIRLLNKEEVHAHIVAYFWSVVGKDLTVEVTEKLRKIRAFEREPSVNNHSYVQHVEERAPIIELCHHLIHAKQFEKAFGVYYHSLASFLYHQVGAYQGLFKESSHHINTALSIFKEVGASAPEGAAWAYQALCLLLAGEIHAAFLAVQRAHRLAEEQHYERDIIRAEWLLGLALVRSALQENEPSSDILQEAEVQLSDALHRCRRIDMVDYEADLLLAWARLHHTKGERQQAKEDAKEALVIANRSDFRVLRADIYNLLARLGWEDGDYNAAINVARSALNDALCDGPPYCYKPALEEAKQLLKTIQPDSINKVK